ncbi:MAG: DUF2723 domain-containing protein [Chromatiales bacterium]|nr:DUF2723 domain-containing protein [Chromatiales bacterium]
MAAYLFWNHHAGLSFFDSSEYSIHIRSGGIPHAPGYPLYILLGQLLNRATGDPFLAQHLISLLSLLFAAYAFHRSLERAARTDGAEPALLLTVALLLSSYYLKKFTVLPEVFLLNVALFAALGWALAAWYASRAPARMAWVFFVYGLGAAHHHTLALTLPATIVLIAWRIREIPPGRTALFALLGFVAGALPLLQLFFAVRPAETFTTYFFVETWRDFLFVLLREGYGTTALSAFDNPDSLSINLRLTAAGLLRNFNFVGALLIVPLMAWLVRERPWGGKLREHPLLVYAGLTLAAFLCVFVPLANLPSGGETYKNAYLRFLTIPGFLLLYPAYYGFRHAWLHWTGAGNRRAIYAGAFLVILLSNLWGWQELRFRRFDLLDEHVRLGYETIFREAAPAAVLPEAGLHKCAIFVRADSLTYGVRYFNAFEASNRCFVFAPTAFSGQFRARFEEQLQADALGPTYPQLLAANLDRSQELIKPLFTNLGRLGYRLFVFYAPDVRFFDGTPLRARPVGNIVELVPDDEPPLPANRLAAAHSQYLDDLEAYLKRRKPSDIPTNVVDDLAWSALTQNLPTYGRLGLALADPGLASRHAIVENEVNALFSEVRQSFP